MKCQSDCVACTEGCHSAFLEKKPIHFRVTWLQQCFPRHILQKWIDPDVIRTRSQFSHISLTFLPDIIIHLQTPKALFGTCVANENPPTAQNWTLWRYEKRPTCDGTSTIHLASSVGKQKKRSTLMCTTTNWIRIETRGRKYRIKIGKKVIMGPSPITSSLYQPFPKTTYFKAYFPFAINEGTR